MQPFDARIEVDAVNISPSHTRRDTGVGPRAPLDGPAMHGAGWRAAAVSYILSCKVRGHVVSFGMTRRCIVTAKLSTRRQATFPVATCAALGLQPGDTIRFERRAVGEEIVWVVHGPEPDWSWFGAGRPYAAGKSHDMRAVRKSIARGRARRRP
jgi:bifunctional DNA-binding transcriptional regulator/antitoxin component of YhaV-PrlF toxin-antitoxin module